MFPPSLIASISFDDTRIDTAKVFNFGSQIDVYGLVDKKPALIMSGKNPFIEQNGKGWNVTLMVGDIQETWTISKRRGCNCGNPLKGFVASSPS